MSANDIENKLYGTEFHAPPPSLAAQLLSIIIVTLEEK